MDPQDMQMVLQAMLQGHHQGAGAEAQHPGGGGARRDSGEGRQNNLDQVLEAWKRQIGDLSCDAAEVKK